MKLEISEQLKKLAELSLFPVYITGGFLRNKLASLGGTDIDLCGPVAAAALGLPKYYYIKTVNFRLGTSIIRCGGEEYEYTPFRTENYSEGGAHAPTSVGFTSDINKDVVRRDFACNSLYYDIKNERLIDLAGGVNDCTNNILRALNPEKTFASDGLRLMRLARIAAETGFKIEAKTAAAAVKNAHLIKDISAERKRDELIRILSADQKYNIAGAQYRGLKLIHKLGLLKYLLPRLAEGEGMAQNPEYHKYDVLEHTFQTVKFADPKIRLAALMHDIGKPYSLITFGKMHGHERASEHIAREVLGERGFRFPVSVIDETARLCLHHMYDLDGKTSENKIRVFVAQNADIIDKLALLNAADALGSGMCTEVKESRILMVRQKMLDEGAPFNISELKIDGTALIEIGLFGAEIGELLNDMLIKCILEPRLNTPEWLTEHAKRHLERKKNNKE